MGSLVLNNMDRYPGEWNSVLWAVKVYAKVPQIYKIADYLHTEHHLKSLDSIDFKILP